VAFDFETVFAESRTPMAIAEADTLRFVRANAAFCEMLGYPESELAQLDPLQLTHPEDAPREAALFQEILEAARPSYSLEKRFLHASGRVVWASVTVTVFRDEEGRPTHGVAICEDVTARRAAEAERLRLETEMLRSQKLESLGLMAGGIAHDFNNILVGVVGNAELARADASPAQRELLDEVLESAAAAAALCQQMLAYSGGGAVEVRRLDLAAAARAAVRLLDTGRRRQVELELTPGEVDADLNQMHQLVLNLVTNACEALRDPKGRVRVRVHPVVLDAARLDRALHRGAAQGEAICLEVEDDGVGIDPDTLAAAFEPFVSTKGQGRGLGLAAVLGIVRSHEATLWVDRLPAGGTRFVIAFPPPRGARERAAELAPIEDELTDRTVLVVEDQPAVRRLMERVLTGTGNRVVLAEGVEDARERLAAGHFDLVVSDLTLTDGLGIEVLRAASERGVPGLLVTGHSEGALRPDDGALEVLRKPFRPRELLDALARLTSAAAVRA